MIKTWIRRFLIVLGLSIAFQVVLKPVRLFLVHNVLVTAGKEMQSEFSEYELRVSESVGFYISEANQPEQKSSEWFAYTGFGNLYFLIGASILVLLGSGWKPLAWLLALHFVLSILAGGFLVLGLWMNSVYWLYAMDFTVSKAVPAATGMFVLMQKRKSIDA